MKKLAALLLVFAMVFAFVACGDDAKDPETTTANSDVITDVSDDITEAVADPANPDASESETQAAPADDASTVAPSEDTTDTTAVETTVNVAELTAPTATADIVALYNNAVNGAFNAKAGFQKTRSTDNEVLDAGVALKALKSLVYKFAGIGEENKYTVSVTKGNWESDAKKHYLRKSTLTAADVTGAKCTLANGKYTITLNIKGGNSVGSQDKKYTNAPLDKCGLCVGKEDKGYYDHKTAEVVYDAVEGTYAGAKIEESYSNAKAVAVVDAATGRLEKLSVDFDIKVYIDISIGKGTATGTSHVRYTDFKY